MKSKFNSKVVALSLLALVFIALTFILNPYFIIGAIVLMFVNQRELTKNKKK